MSQTETHINGCWPPITATSARRNGMNWIEYSALTPNNQLQQILPFSFLLVFENKLDVLVGEGHQVCADQSHHSVQHRGLDQVHVPDPPEQPCNDTRFTVGSLQPNANTLLQSTGLYKCTSLPPYRCPLWMNSCSSVGLLAVSISRASYSQMGMAETMSAFP